MASPRGATAPKNGCMTPKLLWGPFLIQTYNNEPLLAWAIKTTKVNTVPNVNLRR